MKLLKILGFIFVTVVITSCASMVRPKEVQLPPERISQIAYSLVPLDEKGWRIMNRNEHQLALVKSGKTLNETYVIQATSFNLPPYKTHEDFARLVKEGLVQDVDPQHFEIVKHEMSDKQSDISDCVISHMVTEDKVAGKKVEGSGAMRLEMLSLICVHPKTKDMGISVVYSQRYYSGKNDTAFVEKGMSLLSSVEFINP